MAGRDPRWNWGWLGLDGSTLSPCPLFFWLPLTPLSLVSATPPGHPCLLPSAPVRLPYLSRGAVSRTRKHFSRPTGPAGGGGVGLKLGALVPLPRTSLSLEPVPGVQAILFSYPSSIFPVPPPCPPAMTASAWEITDTESAGSPSVLLTGDFLPLRALWWDQGPSRGLGMRDGGKKGPGRRTSGWRGRGEGQKVKREEGGWIEERWERGETRSRKHWKDERTVREVEREAEGRGMGKGERGREGERGN